MRVLMCPDFRPANPYQQLLAAAVSRHNISVHWGGYGRFALLQSLKQKPDIIHLHWTVPFWLDASLLRSRVSALRFLAELLEVRRRGVKLVWTIHIIQDHEHTNLRLEHAVNRQIFRLVDHVLVDYEFMAASVLQTYHLPASFRHKVTVTGHGSYIDSYENTISQEEARRDLRLPADALVFLFVGLIRPYKGVPALIHAFRQLEIPHARLLIAGHPEDAGQAELVREACVGHPRIHLHLGFIPDGDIQRFMNAADVVVLPFEDRATSGTAILAMSFGKALVSSALVRLPPALDGQGCLVYDEALGGLTAALRQAAAADWRQMGRHNLELARQLDWNDIGRQTVEVYRRL